MVDSRRLNHEDLVEVPLQQNLHYAHCQHHGRMDEQEQLWRLIHLHVDLRMEGPRNKWGWNVQSWWSAK